MAGNSLSAQVNLHQSEWADINDAAANFHSIVFCCPDLDAERRIDLIVPVLRQLSAALAVVAERLDDEGGGPDR